MGKGHIILLIFPFQGCINPAIQFAKQIAQLGVEVTVLATLSVKRRVSESFPAVDGLYLAVFSDGFDDGFKLGDDYQQFLSEFGNRSSKAVGDLIDSSAREGRPVTRLVNATIMPPAARVCGEFNIPCTMLWIQAATVFSVSYYYFNGYADAISNTTSSPVELPRLSLLSRSDIPTFLLPSSPHYLVTPYVKEMIEDLNAGVYTEVLVNSFDALESMALDSLRTKIKLVTVGPLVPPALFDDETHSSDTSYGMDLVRKSGDHYVDWLNSKPTASVVYISFGSIAALPKQQVEEIAAGLLKCGRPFLWVLRDASNWDKQDGEKPISCIGDLEKLGLIVPWCSQIQVLRHPSLGCFFTHCGWNSTGEAIVSGIPVVGFPQFTDQTTDAMILRDVVKSGVRVRPNEEGTVSGDEIGRCIEIVMGDSERGEEMRRNAKRWRSLAKEAVMEGGSSYLNLKEFVNENVVGP